MSTGEKKNLSNAKGRCKATNKYHRLDCKFRMPGPGACAYISTDNETCTSKFAQIAALASIPALPDMMEVAA